MDMAIDQSRHYSATCGIQYCIGACPIAFGIEGCDPAVFNPNAANPSRRLSQLAGEKLPYVLDQ
jgi:hypothetical protein